MMAKEKRETTKEIVFRHTDYGPTDHSGGNSLANASATARDVMQRIVEDASVGDTISYESAELIDDMEWGHVDEILRVNDLAKYDTGGEYKIGWLYAVDGYHLDPQSDDCFGEQPASAIDEG